MGDVSTEYPVANSIGTQCSVECEDRTVATDYPSDVHTLVEKLKEKVKTLEKTLQSSKEEIMQLQVDKKRLTEENYKLKSLAAMLDGSCHKTRFYT